jgi:uncharacterized membrane protein YsdA (DUF1294 family)
MQRKADSSPWALGRVSQWDAAKGLGFVQAQNDGTKLLLRRADMAGRLRARGPSVGESVRFVPLKSGAQLRATQVHTLAPAPAPSAAPRPRKPASARAQSSMRLLVIPAFAVVLGALHLQWPLPRPVPVLYGALSMALFAVYAIDKWLSRRDGMSRVAETSLHLIALMGGWPGALLAQHILRHKTAKPAFLRATWAMVAANILLLLLLATPWLGAALR